MSLLWAQEGKTDMDLVRGLQTPAWLVGLARSIVEAVLFAAIAAVILWLAGDSVPEGLAQWAPVIIVGLRTLEGVIDHIDPSKNRAE